VSRKVVKKIRDVLLFSALVVFFSFSAEKLSAFLDSEVFTLDQNISYSGTLEIIRAPLLVNFTSIYVGSTESFGVLGTQEDMIRVRNHVEGLNEWTLSLAPEGDEWSDGGVNSFKFDGSLEEGRLEVADLSGNLDLIQGLGHCSESGIEGFGGEAFSPSVEAIDLVIANETAQGLCVWDISGIDLIQHIPEDQKAGVYQLGMVLTVN
jgi:hypothetical protein